MIVTSFQDFKLSEKTDSQSFSYCELINSLRNGIIVHCLQENKRMLEKSVFCEAWSREIPQSPVFCLVILYPTGSEICRFWYIKTRERKIAIEKNFCLYLSVHWGDLIEHKKSVIYTLKRSELVAAEWLSMTVWKPKSKQS